MNLDLFLRSLASCTAKIGVRGEARRFLIDKLSRISREELWDLIASHTDLRSENLEVPLRGAPSVRGALIPASVKRLVASVHLNHYVAFAGDLLHDPYWKVVNMPLLGGRVYFTKKKLDRWLEEAAWNLLLRYEEEASQYVKGVDIENIISTIVEVCPEVAEWCKEARRLPQRVQTVQRSPSTEIPPCVEAVIERVRQGVNLSHPERFLLMTFMIHAGKSDDEIVELFRGVPDFDEKKTRYFIQHARKKGYLPYSCQRIEAMNLCPGCPVKGKCRNPLSCARKLKSIIDRQG